MDMTFIKNFELIGYYIGVCKTVKEFIHELKNYTNFTEDYFHGCSFKQYMNNEYDESDVYKSAEGNISKDVFIWIEYNDGSHFCYCEGKEGNFKLTGIKWASISDGSGYTVYKYDLYEEWENVKETLTEEEEKAIELGISIENYRISKALQAEEQKQSEQVKAGAEQSEQEQVRAEQEQSKSEQEQAEQEQIPSEIPFAPNDFLEKPEYKINVLDALKEAGYNSGYIRKNKIFPESTVQKFRTGNTDISINTIFRVCQILNKDISEIITFKGVEK